MSRIKCRQCELINFASNQNCQRCGANLSPNESLASGLSKSSRSIFSSVIKILILLLIGISCYIGYSKYVEESNKVVQQYNRQQEEQKEMKKAYGEAIKNEIKKIPTPTP